MENEEQERSFKNQLEKDRQKTPWQEQKEEYKRILGGERQKTPAEIMREDYRQTMEGSRQKTRHSVPETRRGPQDAEEKLERQLRESRARKKVIEKLGERLIGERESQVAGELAELIENGHKTTAFFLALLLAVISDFADFFVLPALPLVGDALDLFTGGALTIFFWHIGGFIKIKVRLFVWGASLFELLPFGINDIVPTYVLGVVLAWHIVNKTAKEAEDKMKALEEKPERISDEGFEESGSYAT